jgi:hypothetical protein
MKIIIVDCLQTTQSSLPYNHLLVLQASRQMWLQRSLSLCFQLTCSTSACRSHLSSLNSAEPAGFSCFMGCFETHLDGSTGPYARPFQGAAQPVALPNHIHYCSSTCDPPECTFTRMVHNSGSSFWPQIAIHNHG